MPVSKVDNDNECVGKGTAYNARNSRAELSPPADLIISTIHSTLSSLPTLSSLFSVSTLDVCMHLFYRVFSKGRNEVGPSKSLIFWTFSDVLEFF